MATLAILLAACSAPSASVTPSPAQATISPTAAGTVGPSPTTAPSVAPSVAPSPPGFGTLDVFPPGAAVQVAVKELNLRKNPSTAAKRIATLSRGDVLVISPNNNLSFGFGPVSANGYTWYPVMITGFHDGMLPALPASPVGIGQDSPIGGWVATNDGQKPYVTALPPRCPVTADLVQVQGMLAAERIACFGSPIVLEGTFGCGGCGGVLVGTYKPRWLATPAEFDLLSVDASERLGPLALRFPPDGPSRPAAASIIRVTVHVDDPRSTRCTMIEGDEAGGLTRAVDARTAVLYCRERLVVESYEIIGTDPDFPYG
jgi:hypothetical protein